MQDIAAVLLNFGVSWLPLTAVLIPALLIAAVAVYFKFRITPDGSHRSIVRFALGGLAAGIVAGGVGMAAGVVFFCSYSLGNLCGLGGVFFSGPLAFGVALVVYLFCWARNGAASSPYQARRIRGP